MLAHLDSHQDKSLSFKNSEMKEITNTIVTKNNLPCYDTNVNHEQAAEENEACRNVTLLAMQWQHILQRSPSTQLPTR